MIAASCISSNVITCGICMVVANGRNPSQHQSELNKVILGNDCPLNEDLCTSSAKL